MPTGWRCLLPATKFRFRWCAGWRLLCLLCVALMLVFAVFHEPLSVLLDPAHCIPKRMVADTKHCPLTAVLEARSVFTSVRRLRGCHVVLYNRVPKCASRTVLGVFNKLACTNGFRYASEVRPNKAFFTDPQAMVSFGKSLMETTVPTLMSMHLHFINFSSLNLSNPVYINVIRDPLQRVVSHYHYNQHGSKSKPLTTTPRKYNQSLDDCVRTGSGPCWGLNQMLPYFCGHHRACRHRGEVALKRAKRAVREQYLLVGLTEDLPAFMETLAELLPHFFRNATAVYDDIAPGMWQKYRTINKVPISNNTEMVLRDHLSLEYEFYEFVRQRFYSIHRKALRLRAMRKAPPEEYSDIGDTT